MPAFLVFNELSLTDAAPDATTAKQYLDDLSEILLDQRIAARRVLVTPPCFRRTEVSAGYSVGRWLADYGRGDVDRRRRMQFLLDRSMAYETCVSSDDIESADIEYKCHGRASRGLPTALLIDGLAVSLQSHGEWDQASIHLEKCWIQDEQIQTLVQEVDHASRTDHLSDHGEWLNRTQTPAPTSGTELWKERASLFPSLDFCESVEGQVRELLGGEPRFKAVVRGLRDLESYCKGWITGNFDIKALIRASGESVSTLNMYSEERKFRCPDGQYRLFEWHVKRGESTRIHFFDVPAQKRILVGYVGGHLRISSE